MALIEFPADDPERALRFWRGVLGVSLRPREQDEGEGWQSDSPAHPVGVHARGPGPGDTASLPYFEVPDIERALNRVEELGGTVIHPGRSWAVCRDSEGNPFGVSAAQR
jgi:predicted enzyme related to lactoylglutathione lyase